MAKKERIYYARTYRHLRQSTIKNVLYFLLLILPVLIGYYIHIDDITIFVSGLAVRVLGGQFPGCPITITGAYDLFFRNLYYVDMPTVYPGFAFTFVNMVAMFAVLIALCTGRRRGHPIAIYLIICMVTHLVNCVYFLFAEEFFPYETVDFSGLYMSQQVSIWFIFVLLSGLVTCFIGARGYGYKSLTFLSIMAYSFTFGCVRYIVFLYVLERFSILYMALMFFVLGPLFDFLYMVCIYSFFINKMIKLYDVGKGREDWQWS